MFDAVVRGAKEELNLSIGYLDVVPVGQPIATEKSINTVFVLDTLTSPWEFRCGEGSAMNIPLKDLPHYIEKGLITEATYTTGLRVKEFVEEGLHTSLKTPGLSDALVAFAQAMPAPDKVDMAVLGGDLVSLSKEEQALIVKARAMGPKMVSHLMGALGRVEANLKQVER